MSARHAAIVLAAGASRRMGRPKQLIEIDGESLIRRVVLVALATAPTRTLIVVGAYADEVFAKVADLKVERVDCLGWDEGMAASLRTGIAALRETDGDGVLLLLCDQPGLDHAHLCGLCTTWRGDESCAVASAYADTIGVPALLPRTWFADLRALRGDSGARELLRSRGSRVVAIKAPALARDIDLPGDC
jgi:molybdenum cofactor cytidylyltransferase